MYNEEKPAHALSGHVPTFTLHTPLRMTFHVLSRVGAFDISGLHSYRHSYDGYTFFTSAKTLNVHVV